MLFEVVALRHAIGNVGAVFLPLVMRRVFCGSLLYRRLEVAHLTFHLSGAVVVFYLLRSGNVAAAYGLPLVCCIVMPQPQVAHADKVARVVQCEV